MSKDNDTSDTRKPYQTPKLKIIELVADEVLAAGCKMKNIGMGQNPGTPCLQGFDICWQDGS